MLFARYTTRQKSVVRSGHANQKRFQNKSALRPDHARSSSEISSRWRAMRNPCTLFRAETTVLSAASSVTLSPFFFFRITRQGMKGYNMQCAGFMVSAGLMSRSSLKATNSFLSPITPLMRYCYSIHLRFTPSSEGVL